MSDGRLKPTRVLVRTSIFGHRIAFDNLIITNVIRDSIYFFFHLTMYNYRIIRNKM